MNGNQLEINAKPTVSSPKDYSKIAKKIERSPTCYLKKQSYFQLFQKTNEKSHSFVLLNENKIADTLLIVQIRRNLAVTLNSHQHQT